jgi:serine/threonine protein kinase
MKMFGKYELGRVLGRGGFSEVYLARYTGIDGFEKVLVVKIMLPSVAGSPEFVSLFIQEARVTAQLSHPNIVTVFDFGKVDERYYMAMEYVKGPTLAEIIAKAAMRGEKIPMEVALHAAHQTARALSYAHTATDSQGRALHAVHRDINPRNIFLTWDGAVKIADFGMTGIRAFAESFRGKAVGTMGFMSPEQAMGGHTDGATDVFATGLVLYNMLAGVPAYDTTDQERCINDMASASYRPLKKVLPGAPDQIGAIITRATRRRPQDRFGDADEMAEAIHAVLYGMGRVTDRTVAEYLKAR